MILIFYISSHDFVYGSLPHDYVTLDETAIVLKIEIVN